MKEARSVNNGWVVVGLILLVSALAGFQVINPSAYAQLPENGTVGSSSTADLPSNLLQNQLLPDQNSLIATPGPSSDDLDQSPADEQSLDTGETIGNSIVQSPAPGSEQLESSEPGVGEQNNQPKTDDNDNNAREGQQGDQEAEEANDGGDEEDGEDGEDGEDEEVVNDASKEEIPSSLRNWLPFP